MASPWSLSESKFPPVSKTLLSIQTDLNNAVVWRISSSPFISKSYSPSINPLLTAPSAPIAIDIIVTFMFHSFSFLLQDLATYIFFRFLSFLLCGQLEWQSPLFSTSWTIPSGSPSPPRFFFVCVILFGANLLHSFVMRLIISFQSPHNLQLLFCCIFSIHSSNGVILRCQQKRCSFSLLVFLFLAMSKFSRVRFRLFVAWNDVQFFFSSHICFLGFCYINACVVCIVYGRCNQSFSVVFGVVFLSLYRWLNTILNDGKSYSSFFSMAFSINIMTWYLEHFETIYYSALRDYILYVLVVIPHHSLIFPSRLAVLVDVLINVQ